MMPSILTAREKEVFDLLVSNSEDSGIVVLADSLSILDKVKTMNYHMQRL